MKKTLYLLFIAILASCGNSGTTTPETTADSTATTTITTPVNNSTDANTVVAVFDNCVFYTGSTQYFFTKANGEKIEFSVPNVEGFSPEELAQMRADGTTEIDIKFSDPMLDPSEDLEGIPGANPALVGKEFLLIYNEKGNLTEVKLKK